MLLRTKGISVEVGRPISISYDPKRVHEIYVADRHPRFAYLRAIVGSALIGILLIGYALVRWGLS